MIGIASHPGVCLRKLAMEHQPSSFGLSSFGSGHVFFGVGFGFWRSLAADGSCRAFPTSRFWPFSQNFWDWSVSAVSSFWMTRDFRSSRHDKIKKVHILRLDQVRRDPAAARWRRGEWFCRPEWQEGFEGWHRCFQAGMTPLAQSIASLSGWDTVRNRIRIAIRP